MIKFGDAPVPWGAMWSGEDEYYVGKCPWFGVPAIMQREAQGSGTPRFGSPHATRQRKLHALCLCDICAKPLKTRAKFSLSNFGRPVREGEILTQQEPLICRDCAALSLRHCPSLRRQLEGGRLGIRQVFRHQSRPAMATPEELTTFAPDYIGPPIAGLGVVEISSWRDVTQSWLSA